MQPAAVHRHPALPHLVCRSPALRDWRIDAAPHPGLHPFSSPAWPTQGGAPAERAADVRVRHPHAHRAGQPPDCYHERHIRPVGGGGSRDVGRAARHWRGPGHRDAVLAHPGGMLLGEKTRGGSTRLEFRKIVKAGGGQGLPSTRAIHAALCTCNLPVPPSPTPLSSYTLPLAPAAFTTPFLPASISPPT